jgi:hypothetical protein
MDHHSKTARIALQNDRVSRGFEWIKESQMILNKKYKEINCIRLIDDDG